MSQVGETFFTSVGCMDGRVQCPVAKYGKARYGVKFADTITEAGLVGQVLKKDADPKLLESVKNKILISLTKHLSKGIVVHGHQECAGNPVADEQHKQETKEAARIIKGMLGAMDLEVKPIFIVRNGEDWVVEEL
ncbi:hypothetical protein M1349_03190 [Patescibacteria group bacterium]|nr:hypothetical protein [Patescibacteria group bacterium]